MLSSYTKITLASLALIGCATTGYANGDGKLAAIYPFTEDEPLTIQLKPEQGTELSAALKGYFRDITSQLTAGYGSGSGSQNTRNSGNKKSKPPLKVSYSAARLEVRLMERHFKGQRPHFKAAFYIVYDGRATYSKTRNMRGHKTTRPVIWRRLHGEDLLFMSDVEALVVAPSGDGMGNHMSIVVEIPSTPAGNITPGGDYRLVDGERKYGATSEIGLRASELFHYLYTESGDAELYSALGDPRLQYASKFSALNIELIRSLSETGFHWEVGPVNLNPNNASGSVTGDNTAVAIAGKVISTPSTTIAVAADVEDNELTTQPVLPLVGAEIESNSWLGGKTQFGS